MNKPESNHDEEEDLQPEKARGPWLVIALILLLVVAPLMYLLVHFTGFVRFAQLFAKGFANAQTSQARSGAAFYVNRGIAKAKQGDYDGAIADYNEALKIDPEYFYAYLDRGYARQSKGELDAALADYDKAIAIKPDPQAYLDRGITKEAKGDMDGAIADYDSVLNLEPENYFAYLDRGVAKGTKGDAHGAMGDFNRAIQIDPGRTNAYIRRGFAKKSEGDFDGALADYEKVIQLKPGDAIGYLNRGIAREAKEDWDGALADFDKASALKPKDVSPYVYRVFAERSKGDLDGALKDCEKQIELNPHFARAYAERGSLKLMKGDQQGALADGNKAVEMNPRDYELLEYRGQTKVALGDAQGAMVDYDKAVELAKKFASGVLNDRGCLHYDLQEFPAAVSDFRKAAELGTMNPVGRDYPHFRIYLAREFMHEDTAASEELEAYMAKRTAPQTREDWQLKIGRFLTGQLPEAEFIAAADDANEIKRKQKECEAWYYAGEKKLIAGDKAAAQEDFKKSVATSEMDYLEYASAVAELKRMGDAKN